MSLPERSDWLILIIGIAGEVDGATRLQKYAFMASRKLRNLEPFYANWEPSRYGPISTDLARDIDYLVKEGYVTKQRVKNELDYWVERFSLTPKGLDRYATLIRESPPHIRPLRNLIVHYGKRPIIDLLNDLYVENPEYAISGSTSVHAGTQKYESDAYVNDENDGRQTELES